MKTKSIIANVALALTLGVLYTGCDKTKDDVLDTDTSSASDNSTSESAFSDVFKSVSEVSDADAGLKSAHCYTVKVDTSTGPTAPWPKTVTINFDSCSNKKGTLTAVFTGRWGAPNTIITITADSNFHCGVNKVNMGTHTIINRGLFAGHKRFDVNVAGAFVHIPNKGAVSWSTTRTVTWIAGDTTADPSDDVYQIEGQTTGVSAKGVTFSAIITTPLIVANNCPWIESGVITLTPKNKKTRTIDFGNGACDNKATVTVNGKTFDVTM